MLENINTTSLSRQTMCLCFHFLVIDFLRDASKPGRIHSAYGMRNAILRKISVPTKSSTRTDKLEPLSQVTHLRFYKSCFYFPQVR